MKIKGIKRGQISQQRRYHCFPQERSLIMVVPSAVVTLPLTPDFATLTP